MNVSVTICERGAVYVNDSRITTRATKWGARATLATFDCPQEEVAQRIRDSGFADHLKNIDAAPYDAQAKAVFSQSA